MVIKADGSVRISNWKFHGRETAEPAVAHIDGSVPTSRRSILNAIRATSERHTQNRSLRAVGLSATEWHVLFQALIEAESAYNPTAVSPKGAYGLGQLMPATARSLGVDRSDPRQNLEGAARYEPAYLQGKAVSLTDIRAKKLKAISKQAETDLPGALGVTVP